jgi:hypothetical protein
MGAKTKNVGGGAATAVAQDWNGFLKQGLNNGIYGSAMGQTQGVGGAINNALSGNSMNGGPNSTNWSSILQQMGNFNPAQLAGATSPQQGAQYQGMQNFAGVSPLSSNFNFFGNMLGAGPNLNGVNPMQGFGQGAQQVGAGYGGNIAGIANQLAGNAQGISPDRVNMGQLGGMMGQTQNAQGLNFNPFQSGGADFTGPTAQAIKQIADQQLQQGLNDVRSRYSAGGGQMFGTSAQHAEGQVLSQAVPALMAQLGQLNQQEAGIQGANNALNLQGMLGANQANQNAVGMNNQSLQQNIGNLLNATQINQQGTIAGGQLSNQSTGTALDALLGLRGQDLSASGQNASNGLQARGLDLQQLGNYLNFAGNTYGQQLGGAGNLASILNSQNQGINDMMLGQRGQDIQSLLGQAGINMDMFGLQSNNQLANNSQQLQQQELMQQLMGMQGNLALGGDQMMNQFQQAMMMNNSQNQMNMLQMLMGGYGQANQLGTAQRQTIQKPSAFGQAMGAIGGIAGAIPGLGQLGGMMGGLFGGGGGGGGGVMDAAVNFQPSPIGTGMWNNAGYGSWQ